MGRIQSNIGLVTGIPIQDTVDQLIAVSAQPRDALVNRTDLLQAEKAAITELTAAVLAVQLAGQSLSSAGLFDDRTASSSNASLLGVAVTGEPNPGTYQFTPLQRAQSHQLLSGGVASLVQPIGQGQLRIQFGGFASQGAGLELLGGGAGVAGGKIRIFDRSGASAEVDLRFAVTVDDVIQTINATSGINITAEAQGDRLRLIDNTGQTASNLRVQEVAGGTTAAELGLAGIDVAASQATGGDVLRLDQGMLLRQLNDGLGLSLRQGLPDLQITFRDGSSDLLIDLDDLASPAQRDSATLGDLLQRINEADPARLSAQISADGDRLELTDLTSGGSTFSIASPFGGTLAEQLGLTGAAVSGVITGGRLLGGLKDTLLANFGGSGLVQLGDLVLTDRNGASDTINLATAETLGDVVAAINAASVDITAAINPAGSGLLLTDTSGGAGDLIVANGGDATQTADKLQLAFSGQQSTIDSGALHRRIVGRQTRLEDLNAGAGVAAGKFVITDTLGSTAVIDTNDPDIKSIGDVIDRINAAGLAVQASINGTGDGIQLTDTGFGAETLKVAASGSAKTAADLHLLGEATIVNVQGTPTQVIDGSTALEIDISDTDTLADVVAAINALGAGVSASVFSSGSGSTPHRISLSSQVSGKTGELLIDGGATGLKFSEIVAAQDARLLFGSPGSGGLVTTSSTNQFDSVLNGVTLTVEGTSTEPVAVTVQSTSKSLVSSVETFVNQYNALRDKLDGLTFFDENDSSTGLLFGSNEALRIDTELSRLLTGRFFGVGGVQSLEEIGLSTDAEGRLSLDKAKLQAKFDSDAEGLRNFFTTDNLGFADKLDTLVDSLAGAGSSLLINRADTLSRKIDTNQERIDQLTLRLERERELLLKQFFTMETVIARLQESLSAITNIQPLSPLQTTRNQN